MPTVVGSLQIVQPGGTPQFRSRFFNGKCDKHALFTSRVRIGRRTVNPVLLCRAAKKGKDGSGSNGDGKKAPRFGTPFPDGNSEIESPVPWDQLPINEFNSLQDSKYFSWAVESVWLYGLKLAAVGAGFALVLGWPVASLSVNPEQDFWKCAIGALCGGIMGATLAALRLYLGWAHIGNRLFSATVEYEETGWYDGEMWVKPPEVLARDRLVGSYTVKPALNRVKVTLIGLAVWLSVCVLLLCVIPDSGASSTAILQADEEAISNHKGGYNDKSARFYEPDAFADEPEAPKVSTLTGYCTGAKQ